MKTLVISLKTEVDKCHAPADVVPDKLLNDEPELYFYCDTEEVKTKPVIIEQQEKKVVNKETQDKKIITIQDDSVDLQGTPSRILVLDTIIVR